MADIPLKPRRKPVQSRSRVTQNAILDAFVRLLLERGYARLTIRDLVAIAGVGLGTLYEYFPNKKSIAANCIHQRFKSVGDSMLVRIEAVRGKPLGELVDALLDTVVALHAERPEEWSALIFLERQISDEQAYRTLYRHFVGIWAQAIRASGTPNRAELVEDMAYVLHVAVYGLLYQTLMCRPHTVGTPVFRHQLGMLVHGYVKAAQEEAVKSEFADCNLQGIQRSSL
ncbi:TetR/AcrR family transcriptional regulator [Noviherbaspirillum autotrophicum]|uniref:TetR/AcrR family transcriptional regulator n=1 Tax=Noviherbaspirillum autotrophicum TaxID=709839 RepID=UPI000693680A|nr:TetR/AcrR family transcriptional regulator [Noviherbaspirillum autotrophicum]